MSPGLTPRVLFTAPSAYPLGGVAVWLDYLCAGLQLRGFDPIVGLVQGSAHDFDSYRRAYPGLAAVSIRNRTGSGEGRRRAISSAIENLQPDLVVSVNIADTYPAVRRVRQGGRGLPRVAMSLHGIEADLLGDVHANIDLLDAVIASNRLACKLCLAESGLSAERVLYAPYGVDVAALDAIGRRRSAESRLRIAWVGRLEQDQKQVQQLPSILEALDRSGLDYQLCIAGDGPERTALLANLSQWIQCGRVEWRGALSAADVPGQVYREADVLLLTSTWETGPIVIWEAMAAGVCVVATRYIGSGLEGALVHDTNCLIFDVGDAAGAAAQISRTSDVMLRQRLVVAGRRLVQARYSRECSVESWARALEAVMRLPPTAPAPESAMPPNGRLDRWLGTGLAESLRRILGIHYLHTDAGGEWPHTSSPIKDNRGLLERASLLDRL